MYFIFTLITALLSPVVFPCSEFLGTVHYNPTERTVLAPIVFQGRVHTTITTDNPTGQIFHACVQIQQVFKSPFEISQEICFGSFGIQELCLTYVFEGYDYVFFMNEDFTARYDGFPVAALRVTDELVAAVRRGYCPGQESLRQHCGKIKITSLSKILQEECLYLNYPCKNYDIRKNRSFFELQFNTNGKS